MERFWTWIKDGFAIVGVGASLFATYLTFEASKSESSLSGVLGRIADSLELDFDSAESVENPLDMHLSRSYSRRDNMFTLSASVQAMSEASLTDVEGVVLTDAFTDTLRRKVKAPYVESYSIVDLFSFEGEMANVSVVTVWACLSGKVDGRDFVSSSEYGISRQGDGGLSSFAKVRPTTVEWDRSDIGDCGP